MAELIVFLFPSRVRHLGVPFLVSRLRQPDTHTITVRPVAVRGLCQQRDDDSPARN